MLSLGDTQPTSQGMSKALRGIMFESCVRTSASAPFGQALTGLDAHAQEPMLRRVHLYMPSVATLENACNQHHDFAIWPGIDETSMHAFKTQCFVVCIKFLLAILKSACYPG